MTVEPREIGSHPFISAENDNVGALRFVSKRLKNSLTRRLFHIPLPSEIAKKMLAEENFGIEAG